MSNPELNNYYDMRFNPRDVNNNFATVVSNFSSSDTRNSSVTIEKNSISKYTSSSQRGPMLMNIPKNISINSMDGLNNPIIIDGGLKNIVGYVPSNFGTLADLATIPLINAVSPLAPTQEVAVGSWPADFNTNPVNYSRLLKFEGSTLAGVRRGRFKVVKVTIDNNGTTIANGANENNGFLIGFSSNPNNASPGNLNVQPRLISRALRIGINSPGGISSEVGVSDYSPDTGADGAVLGGLGEVGGLNHNDTLNVDPETATQFITVQNNTNGALTEGDLRVTIWFYYY